MQQFNTASRGCKVELICMQIQTLGKTLRRNRFVSTCGAERHWPLLTLDDGSGSSEFISHVIRLCRHGDPLSFIMGKLVKMNASHETAHPSFTPIRTFIMAEFLSIAALDTRWEALDFAKFWYRSVRGLVGAGEESRQLQSSLSRAFVRCRAGRQQLSKQESRRMIETLWDIIKSDPVLSRILSSIEMHCSSVTWPTKRARRFGTKSRTLYYNVSWYPQYFPPSTSATKRLRQAVRMRRGSGP